MKCRILLYGIISSCAIFICAALNLNALEKAGEKANMSGDGAVPAAKTGQNLTKKDAMVVELVRKLCDVAKGALKLASKQDKALLLTNIEDKLRASAAKVSDGDRDMYVGLIMNGIKLMVEKENTGICRNTDSQAHIMEYLQSNGYKSRRTNNEKGNSTKSVSRKMELAKKVVTKLEHLVHKALENITTNEEKIKMLEKVKAKVTNAFENKETLRDVVRDMLGSVIGKAMKDHNHKEDDATNSRRTYLNEIVPPKFSDPEAIIAAVDQTTEAATFLTTRRSCHSVRKDACEQLKRLGEFKCSYDDNILPLKSVCDGSIDCPDGSDEAHCEQQSADRISSSSEFIKHLKLNKDCFEEIHSDSLLSRQGAMLSGVLKTQLDFIQKYGLKHNDPNIKQFKEFRVSAEELAKELLLITKTFNLAMKGAICLDANKYEADDFIMETGKRLDWELERIEQEIKVTPRSCACEGKYCNNENCTTICKRVCYQKYTLGRFSCKAVSKDGSVTLDEVCDGKFDCIDESDELACATENSKALKFEAGTMYSDLLKLLEMKATTKDFKPVWNQLKVMHSHIRQLQKQSTRPEVDLENFKLIRNAFFYFLVNTFMDMLESGNAHQGETAYEFFLSINEKVIGALKRSHTGNDKIMFRSECFCRGLHCAAVKCSRQCALECAVKPSLTTYACDNVTGRNKTYTDIENVCDGRPQCPKADDEKDCKTTEICRNHHLVVLRHNIEKLNDKKYHGTILGDVIKDWIAKVTSTIVIAEKASRPTPSDIKTLIRTILDDLVTAYVSMYDQRKAAKTETLQNVYKKFERLSQQIILIIKSCGK